MKERQIVVTGGRDYQDFAMVEDTLDFLAPAEVLVGDCPTGVDKMVREWCDSTFTPCTVFKANWEKHGKAAGPKRNSEMVRASKVDAAVIAFPGGKGTADCVRRAISLNRIVMEVKS